MSNIRHILFYSLVKSCQYIYADFTRNLRQWGLKLEADDGFDVVRVRK